MSFRKSSKIIAIKLLFCVFLPLLIFISNNLLLAATPLMPQDPYSNESYQLIKNYYQIHNGLPAYQLKEHSEVIYDRYRMQTIKLAVAGMPDVVFVLKLPLHISKPIPAVVLFSGFQTGAQSLLLVEDSDSIAYVGFEYPWPMDMVNNIMKWDWKRVEVVPVLMALSLVWLQQYDIIDSQKISVVNISFGNMFYPLAQRILNDQGIIPKAVVLGYGGAEISEVVGTQLQNKLNPIQLEITKAFIKNQTWIVEPKFHLPHLKSPLLVVNGAEDEVFSTTSKQLLIDNLTQKSKVITLPGGHIQPDRADIIQSFMGAVIQFLHENKAL